ncbi:DUF5017 domain-containing protein [Pedobacter sp. BS3]|uniref:DUF5017 domain-containing protein n=1 Tax=Pedobacter sp. BS3 TaxID=2567937 RepID=UPI0011ECDAAD|nr:DUF5017 domain-containing protein [Pedobacter sp. BS3]TZF82592.1 DUF5017 domain-containing protein [Pedobacter sp. BS3]
MMKKIFILPALLLVLAACNKKEVASLHFDVSADKTAIKAGDTVTFKISGNPDFLTFYSGEPGHQYEYKDRTNADGTPQLQFTSYRQYGTQNNTLNILVSTDFNNTYTADGIAAAHWTDITSRATLSTGTDNTPSGVIDLSDFKSDKPMYLAFKFNGSTASTQRTWTIKNLVINNVLSNGSQIAVTTIADAGWVPINLNNSPRSWTYNATQIQFQGGAAGIGDNLGWIITKPVFLTKVSPDRGVALKNVSTRMEEYQYVYTTAGSYTPVFVASNTNIYGSETTSKQLSITVAP